MVKLAKILGIIGSVCLIIGAIYSFDYRKVDKTVYALEMAGVNVQLLEIHRRNLQQRIWDMEKAHTNYLMLIEYKILIEDLRLLDIKIEAAYKKKG